MGRQSVLREVYSGLESAAMSPGMRAALRGDQARVPILQTDQLALRVAAQTAVPDLRHRRTKVTLPNARPWVLEWTLPQTLAMVGAAEPGAVLAVPRRLGHGEVVQARLPLSAVLGLEECR